MNHYQISVYNALISYCVGRWARRAGCRGCRGRAARASCSCSSWPCAAPRPPRRACWPRARTRTWWWRTCSRPRRRTSTSRPRTSRARPTTDNKYCRSDDASIISLPPPFECRVPVLLREFDTARFICIPGNIVDVEPSARSDFDT